MLCLAGYFQLAFNGVSIEDVSVAEERWVGRVRPGLFDQDYETIRFQYNAGTFLTFYMNFFLSPIENLNSGI